MRRAIVCWLATALVSTAMAHESEPEEEEPVPEQVSPPDAGAAAPALETVVQAKRSFDSGSATTVRPDQWAHRPTSDASDLLEIVPGVLTLQHAGGGKANQYFLRGFDADHGTDVALSVDGVPVNMVSHAHGQGYSDLNFVLPELVERLDVTKGPYATPVGDFATAGAMNYVLRRRIDESTARVSYGSFNTFRAFLLAAPHFGDRVHAYLAGEIYGTDGPFKSAEHYRRYNAVGSVAYSPTSSTELTLTLQSYAGGWRASGQIPSRLVDSGQLDRFDSLDPSEGGYSQRHSARLGFHAHDLGGGQLQLSAYLVRYRLNLFSNFTFFADDPVNGDQIEQADARWLTGFEGRYSRDFWVQSIRFHTSAGVRLRNDNVESALYHTLKRSRLDTRVRGSIDETSAGLWLEEDITWLSWLRTVVGVRADLVSFAFDDALGLTPLRASSTQAILVSPKASAIFTPIKELDLYANFGRGFHSNDARGVLRVDNPVTPLSAATGYEVGARARFSSGIEVAVTAWALDLDSEIVWVGDEGSTDTRPATKRRGVELEAKAQITRWLKADVSVTWSRARFVQDVDGGREVPLAPRLTVSGGVEARIPLGFYAVARVQALGDRPATPDGSLTAKGFVLVDLEAGWEWKHLKLSLDIRNVLNSQWKQAQFATTSRVAGEANAVTDVNFTPGYPIRVMANAAVYF